MKHILLIIFITLFTFSSNAHARNQLKTFSVANALNSETFTGRLGSDVKFYFGSSSRKVVKKYGEWGSLKKTNAFNKSDKFACEWALLSALVSLKKRALSEGGNAVFVKTNNNNITKSNKTEFECEIGNIIASVALLGTVVKLVK